MAANVPGGQDIYVTSDGALSFTEAHEEGIYPNGSYTQGFAFTPTGGLDLFTFDGAVNQGWALCGDDGQVFALVEGNSCDNPRPVQIEVTAAPGLGAFQYE